MADIFSNPSAVGLRVVAKRPNGEKIKGTVSRIVTDGLVLVEFDPEFVGEWDDNFDYFDPKYLKPDYDPEAMKEIMKKWRGSTGTTAGPEGPMKHVKSFLTGTSRKRKARKNKKTRKTNLRKARK